MCVQPSSNSSTSSNRNTSTSQDITLECDRGAKGSGSSGNPVYVAGGRPVGENDLGTRNDGEGARDLEHVVTCTRQVHSALECEGAVEVVDAGSKGQASDVGETGALLGRGKGLGLRVRRAEVGVGIHSRRGPGAYVLVAVDNSGRESGWGSSGSAKIAVEHGEARAGDARRRRSSELDGGSEINDLSIAEKSGRNGVENVDGRSHIGNLELDRGG